MAMTGVVGGIALTFIQAAAWAGFFAVIVATGYVMLAHGLTPGVELVDSYNPDVAKFLFMFALVVGVAAWGVNFSAGGRR